MDFRQEKTDQVAQTNCFRENNLMKIQTWDTAYVAVCFFFRHFFHLKFVPNQSQI